MDFFRNLERGAGGGDNGPPPYLGPFFEKWLWYRNPFNPFLDKFRDTLLLLQQNDVAPISYIEPEEMNAISFILQELARSNPDKDIFANPHNEECLMSYKMNIKKQYQGEKGEIYASPRQQTDFC